MQRQFSTKCWKIILYFLPLEFLELNITSGDMLGGVMTLCGWEQSDSLVSLLVGLARFLQSGCYDWFPDRACCCSCVDPLSSQAAHVQVQVTHRKMFALNVTVRVFLVFLLYSFNFMLIIIIIYCEHSLRLVTERQFYKNTRLHFVRMEAEYVPEDF